MYRGEERRRGVRKERRERGSASWLIIHGGGVWPFLPRNASYISCGETNIPLLVISVLSRGAQQGY
jgi:hypothetical protein